MKISPAGKFSKTSQALIDRNNIEQADLTLDNSQSVEEQNNYDPIGQLNNSLNTPKNQPVPDQNTIQNSLNPESQDGASTGGSIKIKEALDKLLISAGVNQRTLIQHNKRRFQFNKKQNQGYFEIPERTGSGSIIDESKVEEICNALEKQFNLDTEPVFQGGIWKVTFKPKVIETRQETSSWDGEGDLSNVSSNKSASTINEMVKTARDNWIDHLTKIGFKIK